MYYIETRQVPPHTSTAGIVGEYEAFPTTLNALRTHLLQRSFVPAANQLAPAPISPRTQDSLIVYDVRFNMKIESDVAVRDFMDRVQACAHRDTEHKVFNLLLSLRSIEQIVRIQTERSPSSVKPASSPPSPPKANVGAGSSASSSQSVVQLPLASSTLVQHNNAHPPVAAPAIASVLSTVSSQASTAAGSVGVTPSASILQPSLVASASRHADVDSDETTPSISSQHSQAPICAFPR